MMKWLALVFIVVPTAELALLIYFGKVVGLLPTLVILLATGIGGAYLAKSQGMKAWYDLRRRMETMEAPGNALIDGMCIFAGGILLLIPGFLTDIAGLFLLFKWTRNLLRPSIQKWIYKKMQNGQIIIK